MIARRHFRVLWLIIPSGLEKFGPEDWKQKCLAPLAARLDNTDNAADDDEVEQARGRFLAVETFRRVLSMFCLEALKDEELAGRVRNMTDINDVVTQCVEMGAGVCCVPVKAALMLGENPRTRLPFDALLNGCVNGLKGHPEIAAFQASMAVRLCSITHGTQAPRKYFTIAGHFE